MAQTSQALQTPPDEVEPARGEPAVPQPSPLLRALLEQLVQAKQGTTLVLDSQTIGQTSAAALLNLFSDQLQISTWTLNDVELPAVVTGDTLTFSGTNQGIALAISCQDLLGAVAIQALFQAPEFAPLQKAFTALPTDFFSEITISGASASVAVPGLTPTLTFSSPTFGVAGVVTPSSGLITTSIAPRVDGQVSAPSGAKGLYVELQTPTSGYMIAPLSGAWTFTDCEWLTGLQILSAFPAIIPTSGLGLNTFILDLYPQAPDFSSVVLDVADISDPMKPLWRAAGDKIQLTDVVVTVGLTYPSAGVLALSGEGSVQGNFVLDSIVLTAQIPFPLDGVWSLSAYPNLKLPGLGDLAHLLDGGSGELDGLMPAGLSKLPSFELTYLRVAVHADTFSLVEFTFSLRSTETWKLIPSVFELSSLQIRMTIDSAPSITGAVIGTFMLPGDAGVVVSFGRNSPRLPWRIDVISPATALPSLGDLAQLAQDVDLGGLVKAGGLDKARFVMTGLNLGLTISPTKLTNLGLTLQLANAGTTLNPKLDWEIIPGVLTLTDFKFGFQLSWSTTNTKMVFGQFVLNALKFDITFAKQGTQAGTADALIGEYRAAGDTGTVNIKALIQTISPSVAAGVPDDLNIDLKDALLAYLNSTDGTKKFLFAMDIAVELPISDLPLVGKAVPSDAMVGLKNLKVVVASADLTADDVSFINAMSPEPVLPLPAGGATGAAIPAGFSMVAELELGALSILMTSPPPKPPSRTAASTALVPVRASAPNSVMWINVQKTFGPVRIQKIGFSYKGGSLFVLSNLSLTVGGLEIDLIGIGIGSPIKAPKPEFTIEGLAVSYNAGPISVMGGMIGTLSPLDFVGAVSVKTPALSLAAFAGYAEYQDHPSFFLYGILDTPIGGPPPFFVQGIAAGMGFNRKLVIPDVSGVSTFPLVVWARGVDAPTMDPTQPIGEQVVGVLTRLANSGVVAPSTGDYWIAAGVKFTSFEIIDSFALLTVTVGSDVEIALLGLSTLTLPPEDPVPVAQVQLVLDVSFAYDSGLFAAAAQLTNASYVLSRDCRLTGGFAFYLWFNGEHAGESVVTLGGYNPNFTVPAYYPVVPRLGLSWQVCPQLSVTGGLYFALTSNAVMAGGKLSAVWNSGPISAWFTYWADFLMTFAPFHYYVDGGIDLGASFTIDMYFFSVSVTIHLGVELELWGPPFAGSATVDLSIISFTITFGDQGKQTKTSIEWDKFVEQLLPARPARATRLARGRLADPTPPPVAVVQINVTGGLIRALEPTADGPCYLVTAETFQCSVSTVIPNKDVVFAADPDHSTLNNIMWAPDSEQPKNPDGSLIVANQDFGVGPANLTPDKFKPTIKLTLTAEENSVLHAVRQFTQAPKALWENKTFDAHGVPQVDPHTGLTHSTIDRALVGLTLIPYVVPPNHLRPVPLESLLFTLEGEPQPFAWSPGVPPVTDPFTDETVAGTIATTKVNAMRGALLGALAAQGVVVDQTVNVARLANPATTDLEAAPRLRLLGEQAAS